MQLTHIALWTNHLERLRDFYVKYFNGKSNEKYVNPKKGFASYFVSFESGPALEIMQRQDITEAYDKDHIGLAHLAFHADKKEQVDQMIERFRMDGYTIAGETRVSGDGYYAGVIVVRKEEGRKAEIMNLAVADIFRRRGIARKLLRHVSNKWAPAQDVELLRICTGTSAAGPMMLYQQEGFDLVAVDCDYFVRNYAEPIWENGIQCRHQLILEKRLK